VTNETAATARIALGIVDTAARAGTPSPRVLTTFSVVFVSV
jgi:hypothetical protein